MANSCQHFRKASGYSRLHKYFSCFSKKEIEILIYLGMLSGDVLGSFFLSCYFEFSFTLKAILDVAK